MAVAVLERDLERDLTLVLTFRNWFRSALRKVLRMTFAHNIYRSCAVVALIPIHHKDDPVLCNSAWLNIRLLHLVSSSVSHTSSLGSRGS